MAEILFQTDRLILRRWRLEDEALWLEHINTPQVKQYLGGTQPPERIAERFAKMIRAWDEDGFSFLALERRDDGTFLGTCGLAWIGEEAPPDELRGAIQIGWQLRADAWGQGYASEAARALLNHALVTLGTDCLYAQTSERNRASWRVMQKLGMRRRAELDYIDPAYPPEDNPTMVWSITREEHLAK